MFQTNQAFKGIKKGDKVFYIPDNQYYKVDAVDGDELYLIDPKDGSSFTATEEELKL